MKKLLIILLTVILSLTCISVAFAEDGDEPILLISSAPSYFETISIAGEEASVEGDKIVWETSNRYEQVEMIVSSVPEGLSWQVCKDDEVIASMSSYRSEYIKGLETGENLFTLEFIDEEGNVVKEYSLSITNKGESGGDVFWDSWGQLILVLIFLVAFLLTIYIRYKRKQKMLRQQANARSHK